MGRNVAYRFSRVMERMGSFLRFLRGRARCGTQMPPFSLGRRPYTGSRSILGSASVILRLEIADELERTDAGREAASGEGMKASTEAVAASASAATLHTFASVIQSNSGALHMATSLHTAE